LRCRIVLACAECPSNVEAGKRLGLYIGTLRGFHFLAASATVAKASPSTRVALSSLVISPPCGIFVTSRVIILHKREQCPTKKGVGSAPDAVDHISVLGVIWPPSVLYLLC
jgi:hypothetical protein